MILDESQHPYHTVEGMNPDTQPDTNDFRKRLTNPLFVKTLLMDGKGDPRVLDNQVNDFTTAVADAGGEVVSIASYACPWQNNNPDDVRVVTYRRHAPVDR